MAGTLITPADLAAHLGDREWLAIDCRFELSRPDWGEQLFASGHIPGALYAHLDRDLAAPHTAASGRHPLPSVAALEKTFGRFGIDAAVQVVAYDQGPGSFAARLWWLLRWLGHERVAVLDGGFAAWQEAGLPLSTERTVRAARSFRARPTHEDVVTTAALTAALASGGLARGEPLLVDARAADRFAGENETIDPVAGHIPGARSHPFARNLDARERVAAGARNVTGHRVDGLVLTGEAVGGARIDEQRLPASESSGGERRSERGSRDDVLVRGPCTKAACRPHGPLRTQRQPQIGRAHV